MIVVPEDREPASTAALADRLRALGVTWSDRDVEIGRARLTSLLGDDTRAQGEAAGMLTNLARRTRPIRSLIGWLGTVDDNALLRLPEAPERLRTTVGHSNPQTLAESPRALTARRELDSSDLGERAREQARSHLPPGSSAARIDIEALDLIKRGDVSQHRAIA